MNVEASSRIPHLQILYRGLGLIRALTSPLPEPYALVVEAKDYVMVLGYPISIY